MSAEIQFDPDLDGDPEGHLLALSRLHAGPDPAAALTLIRYLRNQLSSGEPLDPAVLDSYLLPALDRIIDSESPSNEVAKAFGFKAGRGQYRREDTFERDWILAISAELNYREIRQEHDRPGYKKLRGETAEDMAFEKTAADMKAGKNGYRFLIKVSTVRDAHAKHRDSSCENSLGVRDLHTEELRELLLQPQ